ncbi:MAG: response regulator [Armatimonadetes bacterium]|nr:response regulator [Armatimonadota bacterium]
MNEAPVRILVLEDDPDMRDLLADVLRDQGYEVTAVGRGEEAVARAAAEAYDLFVADIRMEGISGLQAIEKARLHQPDLGSLVVSGWASEEETLAAVRLKVGGYLKKPFSVASFLAQVQEILSRRLDQRRKDEQGALLERTALWALGTLSRVADESTLLAPRGTLRRIGGLARRLARSLSLPREFADQIEAGAMVAGLADVTESLPPEELLASERLSPLVSLIQKFATPWSQDPDLPLSARIGALAIEAGLAAGPADELPTAEQLEARFPGRFDPQLLRLYGELRSEPAEPIGPGPELLSGLKDPRRIPRSLLSLAQTLEESGDTRSAEQAYRKVLEDYPRSREAVQACLAVAHLTIGEGRQEEAVEWALRAPREARSLGPSLFGTAALRCGLLLQRLEHPRTGEVLELAFDTLGKLRLAGTWAIAAVALSRTGSSRAGERLSVALELLAQPAYLADVSAAAEWLLPGLLELREKPWPPSADRLILQFPSVLERLLDSLPAASRQKLMDLVAASAHGVPESLLEALCSQPEAELRSRAVELRGRLASRPAPPLLRLHSLGTFSVFLGDQKVDERRWRTQKTRYLLAYLAAHPGETIRDERILDEFWPESRARGKQNLWAATSAIRRALRRPGEEEPAFDFILRDGDMLRLNVSLPRWHDLEELERSLSAGEAADRAGQISEAHRHYRNAAQLYGGPFLDGCFMDWAVRKRGQLEERVAGALCRTASLSALDRSYAETLEYAGRALEIDPLRVEAHLLKMRGHLGLGQPELTMAQFEQCSRMLRSEFDMEPTTELLEVYTRARHGLSDAAVS